MKIIMHLFSLLILCTLYSPSVVSMEQNEENSCSPTQPVDDEATSQKIKNSLLKSYTHIYGTYKCQGRRKTMEDRFVNIPSDGFHGIYDGHAGEDTAVVAQKTLHDLIFDHEEFTTAPQTAIQKAFHLFNEKHPYDKMGTTATTLLFTDDTFIIANVGDSHAVCSFDGQALRITKNHHPSEQEEKERIEILEKERQEKGTYFHEFEQMHMYSFISTWKNGEAIKETHGKDGILRMKNGLALSRALGDLNGVPYIIAEPFIQEFARNKSQEFIILASDGLWDAISEQAAVDFVKEAMNEMNTTSSTITSEEANYIAQRLIETALECYESDNVTVTIVFLNNLMLK